jgi:hypothetical protein
MSSQGSINVAFILSLIGGIVIVLGGFASFFWTSQEGFWYGMMGHWMMGDFAYDSGMMFGFSLAALVSGVLVIVGAIMLNARPQERTAWGIIILIFSIISLMGMGGFFIGAVLGIAGGALALSLRPAKA